MSDIRDLYLANGTIRPGVVVPRDDGLTEFRNLLAWPLMALPAIRTPPEPPASKRKRAKRRRRRPGD